MSHLIDLRPGMPEWDKIYSKEARAERQARDRKRERIMEDARNKGWRHWQGPFFFYLEKKLRSIGCKWPDIWTDDLRNERQFELEYQAKMKTIKTRAHDA